jgi:hypothetical protein
MDINLNHPIFFATALQILKKILNNNKKISNYIFADRETLLGLEKYGEYGIIPWNNSINLGIITKNDIIIELINNCLLDNLTITAHILKDFTKPFNYSNDNFRTVQVKLTLFDNLKKISFNNRSIISLDELTKNINSMAFFNISISEENYIGIIKKYKLEIELHKKIPKIDIFLYDLNEKYYLKYNRNYGATTKQQEESYLGIEFFIFKIKKIHQIEINTFINSNKYLLELYGNDIFERNENFNNTTDYIEKYNKEIKLYNL